MKYMTKEAHFPDLQAKIITNTSVRKHLCEKLLDNNIPDAQAVHITGNKYLSSLNNRSNNTFSKRYQ
jgi:hypothetical protein